MSVTINGVERSSTRTHEEAKRQCLFLSVMMVSLLITNSSEIISELLGGLLKHSDISNALKILCGCMFLYCVPVIVHHFTKAKLIMVFSSIMLTLLNLGLYKNAYFSNTALNFFTMCFTAFMVADAIQDITLLKKYLIDSSRLCSMMVLFMLLLSATGRISSLRTGGYRMGLGYACLPCMMILIWNSIQNRKLVDIIGSAALFLLTMLYSSRGPILGVALFVVFLGYRFFHDRNQDYICIILFAMIALFVLFYSRIMTSLLRLLVSLGITSRNVYLLTNELSHDSGRNLIWSVLLEEIKNNPFQIRGINSDYLSTGIYSHNIVIELIHEHGVIFGGIAVFYVLREVIRTLNAPTTSDYCMICLIFMFASVPSSLVSGTIWTSQNFWIWLALINNKNLIKSL